jgi:GNAT superfamily N-acetyltransferase
VITEQIRQRRRIALLENLRACTTELARINPLTCAEFRDIVGGCVAFNGARDAMTYAIYLGSKDPVSAITLSQIEEFFRLKGASGSIIEVRPELPDNLPTLLEQNGYARIFEGVEWTLPLHASSSMPVDENIQIIKASASEAVVWAKIVAAGFDYGIEVIPNFISRGFAPNCHSFLARQNGTVVGGATLVIREGLAFLRTASTLPQFRGRGVQRALIRARLAFALEQGCDFALASTDVVPSTSSRNLEREGFVRVEPRYSFRKSIGAL